MTAELSLCTLDNRIVGDASRGGASEPQYSTHQHMGTSSTSGSTDPAVITGLAPFYFTRFLGPSRGWR